MYGMPERTSGSLWMSGKEDTPFGLKYDFRDIFSLSTRDHKIKHGPFWGLIIGLASKEGMLEEESLPLPLEDKSRTLTASIIPSSKADCDCLLLECSSCHPNPENYLPSSKLHFGRHNHSWLTNGGQLNLLFNSDLTGMLSCSTYCYFLFEHSYLVCNHFSHFTFFYCLKLVFGSFYHLKFPHGIDI